MSHPHHHSGGVFVTVVGAVINLFLSLLKYAVGVMGNSAALVADAVHSLSDLATDVVVLVTIRISGKAPDEKHPYGHGRAETIGSAIIGAAIFFVGLEIAWNVLHDVMGGRIATPSWTALFVALLSIGSKEALYRWTIFVGERDKSESVMANAWHHRSDALSSVAAAVGIAGAMMGWNLLDPLAAVLVSLMVMHVGWKIFYDSLQNLMDRGVSPAERAEIENIVKEADGVVEFHELKTRKVGRNTFIDIHIQVAPRISISEAHNIAESVRRRLIDRLEYVTDALVHIDAEDDREGRLYRVRREDVERDVTAALEGTPLSLAGKVTLHFLHRRIGAEIPLAMNEELSARQVREHVEQLAQRLLEHSDITEVTIRHDLGRFEKKGTSAKEAS